MTAVEIPAVVSVRAERPVTITSALIEHLEQQ